MTTPPTTPDDATAAPDPSRPCPDCGQVHARCVRHSKHRDEAGGLVPCNGWRMKGQLVCRMHGGATKRGREAGRRRLAEEALTAEVGRLREEFRAEVDALSEPDQLRWAVREARVMAMVWGSIVDQLDVGFGGLYGPDHLGDARAHIAEQRFQSWTAESGRLAKLAIDAGVSLMRAELDAAMGAQIARVLRLAFDGLARELIAAGVDAAVVRSVFEESLPRLVGEAVRAAVAEATGSSTPAAGVLGPGGPSAGGVDHGEGGG